jgi:hypothetical protein
MMTITAIFAVGSRGIFHTDTDTTLERLNGQPFMVEAVYTEPDEKRDWESLPMYDVRIGGELVEAFEDELRVER